MLKVRQYLSRLLVILLLVNLFPLGVYAIGYKTKLYNYCYTPDQQKITPISSETIGTGVSVIKTIINPCTKIDEGITLTITKPQDINDDTNGKVYECVGVIICGNLNINGSDDVDISQISESKYIKFESNVEQKYEVQAEDIVTATTKDFSFLALWKESERKNPVVTYNVNGNAPEGASIFPIIKNFRNQDNGSIDNPEGIWSLGFFSVPSQDNNLRMKDTRETVDITNLTQSCTLGGSITIPSFEQKRAPQFGTERYYPVIGFVAREKDTSGSYQYYKMIGWKDDQGKIYKEGDQYSPTSNVTLNGEWEKINLPDDPNKDLPVPLLKEQTETGTFVKLQQKTTGGEYHSGTTATSTDGLIDYRVVMQFSDVFSAGEMPWMGGTHYYFKTVDNSDFVDSKLKITLDDHVAPVTDADGYTTITIKNASIKVTGIEETTDEEITKNDLSETIRVKLGNMKSFTIDFDWDSYNQNEMTVEIPTKVVDGYIGDITGTKANFSGSLNFDKAHSETSARLPGADFEPDQFVRYVLCLDEKWNSAYGGENMTIEDMLLAAKHIENDLKNINIDSNPVTASASQAVTSLTVDPTSVTVNVGKTQNVYVTILPETVTNKSVTWTSENPSIASVDPNTGTITGITPGSTTITATSVYDTSKSAKVEVTVKGQVKTQVITGGTITVEPEYAAAGETVTLTVKPDADYELIEGTVTGSYSKTIEGKEAEIGNITIAKSAEAEEGTYTFVMPAASPINISAAFLDANNKTVVDPPKTEIKSANGSNSAIQNFVNQYGNIMNVELSEKASEELMQSVTVDNEADDVDYSETQAQKLLSGKVQAGNDIYRHLQTKTDVEVKYYYENGNGAGEMRLDISFKYRVVASTTAKPAEVNFDDNAKVMSKGPNDNKETPESDKGWVEYESKEDTYITVPIPKAFSPDGDWVKIEHE